MQVERPGVDVFDKDAATNDGYLYTHTNRLSCRLATQRTTDAIFAAQILDGNSVLDLACGDAYYSFRFFDGSSMTRFVATDGAENAVAVASRNRGNRRIPMLVSDAHALPFPDNSFDIALVQSVLHHDNKPLHMIQEALRVASRIIIHEPNGNNLGLKVIEKLSTYHKEHGEKSYTSRQMKRLIRQAGGKVVYEEFAGFVPMFCSDGIAKFMKRLEPVVESLPICRSLACAVYVMVAAKQPF